jgi:hypothetical protein
MGLVLLEGVLLEVALRAEGVCAECACVGQHAVLAHLVRAQLAGLDELPVAQLAGVRLLAGVGARVPLEEFARAETLAAECACVRSLAQVVYRRAVARQVAARGQLLAALVALEVLPHAQVLLLHVGRQENLQQNWTKMRNLLV